ncbi:DNA translocase FtsK [Leeia sp. IMCC25680]|uniref:DNA translocase FtsK n=2 Tax=Leeia aquatica TaxID=2725557 RepID=A0A847SF37_9NEIS|nr:DNA translocase FtsK [Leeia aquatica]
MSSNKRNTRNTAQPAMTPQLGSLLRESWWLLLVAAAIYLVLILISYDQADPGWSHSAPPAPIHNTGGSFGAWLSDLLLYLFGGSAWWWVLLCLSGILWGYRRLDRDDDTPRYPLWLSLAGFFVTLTGSCGLESLRLYSLKIALPDEPGGMLGAAVSTPLAHTFGFTGATLVLLASIAIGLSLFAGVSWLQFVEGLGHVLEGSLQRITGIWQTHQDRKAGEAAAAERDAMVAEEKRRQQDRAPVEVVVPGERVEPLILNHPTAPAELEPLTTDDDTSVPETEDDVVDELPPWQEEEAEPAPPPRPVRPEPVVEAAPQPRRDAIPAVKIEPSRQAIKEKQAPLFSDLPDSPLPPLSLLAMPPLESETVAASTLEYTSRLIERKLADFGVQVQVVAAYPGPVITRYEIDPASGVKGSQVVNLARDLARALGLAAIRVVETIPGKTYMALELPNPKRQTVRLSEILCASVYGNSTSPLTLAMGKDISGTPVVTDLAKMPHVLVAGTTGSGKSVAINAMLLSLLYKATPQQVRLILVDPKMLEMSVYEGIPHLLAPVVTDMKQAANALNWCVAEMEKRYKLMSHMGVRNLAGFNQKLADMEKRGERPTNPFTLTPDNPEPLEALPMIVVVIDELADLMMVAGKKIEELIARLAQKARAAGIHLILATQRPSVDVITGLIKANIPTRVAFQVSSKIDSRTILDQMGAETLLGMGDMLYLPPGTGYPQRLHGAFVADEEVHHVVDYLKQHGAANYIEGILEGSVGDGGSDNLKGSILEGDSESDPLYDEAVTFVLKSRRASISAVQRQLRIGYNRAARLIEQMEMSGVVSPMESNGNRTVLVPAREE